MAKSFNTNAVYISYARNPRPEEKHPEWAGIADIIEPLAQAVRDAGITCYTDTADIQNGDSISEFEQAIGRAKCVILVFSARYFTRPHCMYEFKQILNGVSSGKIKKLILIKAGVCNFDDLNFVADLHGEWGRLAWKYEMQPKKAIMEYAKKFNYYKDDIKNLPDFFSSNNYDRAETLDMSRLIRQIKPVFDAPQPRTSSFVKDNNVKPQEPTPPTSTSRFNDKYVLYAALAVMFGIIIWLINRTPEQKNDTQNQPPVEEKEDTHQFDTPSSSSAQTLPITVDGRTYGNMIRVQGGTFSMGAQKDNQNEKNYDSEADSDEKPVHTVSVGDFYIGETEVTCGLWKAVMGSDPSYFKNGDNYPVEKVSWNDCQEFIKKLNQKTGKTFRLPTEAEWEYAARGGNKSRGYKYSGSNNLSEVAWYGYYDDSDKNRTITEITTKPVKTKIPNELGLYDMSGNVWEWCNDWKGSYSSSSQSNPTGASSGSYRVLRGGSWTTTPGSAAPPTVATTARTSVTAAAVCGLP